MGVYACVCMCCGRGEWVCTRVCACVVVGVNGCVRVCVHVLWEG